MWRRLISNSLHDTSGQPTTFRDHFFVTQERRTRRLNQHPTHDGHAREIGVQRRGLLRQGGQHHHRLRGHGAGADSAWFPSISELQVASTASARRHAAATPSTCAPRVSTRIVGVVATVSIHAGADERHLRLRRGLRVGPRLRQLWPAPVQHVGLDGAAALPGLRDEGHGSGSGGRPQSQIRVYRGRVE